MEAVEAALAATAAGAPVLATLLSAAKEEEAISSSLEVAASSLWMIEVSTPSGLF